MNHSSRTFQRKALQQQQRAGQPCSVHRHGTGPHTVAMSQWSRLRSRGVTEPGNEAQRAKCERVKASSRRSVIIKVVHLEVRSNSDTNSPCGHIPLACPPAAAALLRSTNACPVAISHLPVRGWLAQQERRHSAWEYNCWGSLLDNADLARVQLLRKFLFGRLTKHSEKMIDTRKVQGQQK